MEKSGIIVGSMLGATLVLLAFAFVMIPPPTISPPEIIVSNGHGPSTVGEQTPVSLGKELSLIEIFERAETGVVRVNVQRSEEVLSRNGVGSGFVFDKSGHVITNTHVVENSDKLVVTFLDGRSYNAEVIGTDPATDISVIKVDADPTLLKPLLIGDSSNLKVGMRVSAIGNPFGLSGSMTSGIVSALGRLLPQESGFSIPDVIQTDAAINPGNSGGPLLNSRGEVVGINTAIQSATGEFTGVGFAIPSNTIAKIVPKLISDGTYHHPWVGIAGRDINPDLANILHLTDARGFLIVNIVEGSPADKAGLKGSSETKEVDGIEYLIGGDVVLAVDGNVVRKIDDILIHLQRYKSVGDEMVLEILRDGRVTNIVVKLEERPDSSLQ
ncbi:MAG TPA: trypsin-like peptidase domain-containing protein [Nitrosopumilaceae archaeon]|nr:trypsin-like peptidase domain-containing protein [Nitrosopumilaceae archaeon]